MLLLNIVLALAWMAMTGQFTPTNFVNGFAIGFMVLWLVRRAVNQTEQVDPYFAQVRQVLDFVLFYIKELILANLRVMSQVLRPRLDIQPSVVAIPLEQNTDTELTLLANIITLTPGTLSLDISDDRRTLYVHAIDVDDVEAFRRDIKQNYERRVREVLR